MLYIASPYLFKDPAAVEDSRILLNKLLHLWLQKSHPLDAGRPGVVAQGRGLVGGAQLALGGEEGIGGDGTAHGLQTGHTAPLQSLVGQGGGQGVQETVDDHCRQHLLLLRGTSKRPLPTLIVAGKVREMRTQQLQEWNN